MLSNQKRCHIINCIRIYKTTFEDTIIATKFFITLFYKCIFLLSFLCCPIMCLYILNSMLWCPLIFQHKDEVQFVFISSCLQESSCLIYVICVWLHIVVSKAYCIVFLFCLSSSCVPMLPVSLDCRILIAPSVFSNLYWIHSFKSDENHIYPFTDISQHGEKVSDGF